MSKNHRPFRLSLIHQTDLNSAEQIISTQIMIPSASGLYGPGIYFANTIEAANLKSHRKGVFLIADVYPGKNKKVSKKDVLSGNFNAQQVRAEGYTSIYGYHMPTGREVIVFDSSRVKNIKFIFGTRPQAVLSIDRVRITLFFVTDRNTASKISEGQKIPQINGPLGFGCYMYDTISDAIQANPNNTTCETYLAADVYMRDYYRLEDGQNVDDSRISRRSQSFTGVVNGTTLYVLKNPDLIERIHFCGGKPWNEKKKN